MDELEGGRAAGATGRQDGRGEESRTDRGVNDGEISQGARTDGMSGTLRESDGMGEGRGRRATKDTDQLKEGRIKRGWRGGGERGGEGCYTSIKCKAPTYLTLSAMPACGQQTQLPL